MAKFAAVAKGLSAVLSLKKKATRKLDAQKHAALLATKSLRIRALHNLAASTFKEGGKARSARRIKAALEREERNGGEPNKGDPQNCPLHKVSETGLHRTKNLVGDYSMGPLCSGCCVGQKEAEERAKAGGGASE